MRVNHAFTHNADRTAAILRFLLAVRIGIVALPRALLLIAIVYAPWAYGCTRWWAKTLLVQSLLAITLLWFFSFFLRGRWPRVSMPAAILALSLLGLGWSSVWNAIATYDELTQIFSPLPQALPGWLGSWDAEFATRAMLLVTALTGVFFMSMDLAANPLWRGRLFFTLALSGGLLLLFGLVERATAAKGIFWEPWSASGTFFATYFNHSNAGAFINLTLPLVAGQTFLAFQNEKAHLQRAFWCFLLLVSITAVFVNTSRASMAIGALIMIVLAIGGIATVRRRSDLFLSLRFLPTIAVVAACAVILVLTFGIQPSLDRWHQTMNSLFASQDGALWEGRLSIYRICWLSLTAAGWFGFGPGTFPIVFPYLQQEHGGQLDGILRYAHQDYLQTALEWGKVGFVLWALLIGGGIVRAFIHLCKNRRAVTREPNIWLLLCAVSLIGVLIHSLVDFPLQIASLQLIAAVLLGQLWARTPRKEVHSQPLVSNVHRQRSRGKAIVNYPATQTHRSRI
jgi:O-antigen ligase